MKWRVERPRLGHRRPPADPGPQSPDRAATLPAQRPTPAGQQVGPAATARQPTPPPSPAPSPSSVWYDSRSQQRRSPWADSVTAPQSLRFVARRCPLSPSLSGPCLGCIDRPPRLRSQLRLRLRSRPRLRLRLRSVSVRHRLHTADSAIAMKQPAHTARKQRSGPADNFTGVQRSSLSCTRY